MRRSTGKGRLGNLLAYETGDYLLKHLPNGRFQAVLNLNFVPKTDKGTPAQAAEMLERSRQCMNQLTPYLRSPSRQELDVIILTPDEVKNLPLDQRPNPRTVEVSDEGVEYRGDAQNFGTNFNCVTIGHEILHHLGLCDEYHETEEAKFAQWGCRPVTVRPSYMRDIDYSFGTVIPQTTQCECNSTCQSIMSAESKTKDIFLKMNDFEVMEDQFRETYCVEKRIQDHEEIETVQDLDKAIFLTKETATESVFESRRATGPSTVERNQVTCRCPEGISGEYCRQAILEVKRRISLAPMRANCPNGYKKIGLSQIGNQGQTGVSGNVLTLVTQGNGKSLLEPNHFSKVIAGSCKGGSGGYEACASYAYIPPNTPACASMPPECRNDDHFLGVAR